MRRGSILAAVLAALLLSVPAQAQAPRGGSGTEPLYRVELIVFEHLDGRSDRRPAAEPLDFTDALHPENLALLDAALERHLALLDRALPTFTLPPRVGEQAPALVAGEERIQPVPRSYAAVELSPPMRRALERLERSSQHLPVAVQAWFQPAERGRRTAEVRIHDETVVGLHRPELPARPLFLPELGPLIGTELPFETVPMERPIHRLDGTVRLRRTRFLRLELDLVLQEPPSALESDLIDDRLIDNSLIDNRWQLHRLQQGRAVRPDRMEYFDSSRFGVLARITAFDRVEPEPPPAPRPPATPASSPGPN